MDKGCKALSGSFTDVKIPLISEEEKCSNKAYSEHADCHMEHGRCGSRYIDTVKAPREKLDDEAYHQKIESGESGKIIHKTGP